MRRENFGIPLLVHILEERPYDSTTACAADALRAISMNNDENKNRVREAWAIPLLVQLLGSDVSLRPAAPVCNPRRQLSRAFTLRPFEMQGNPANHWHSQYTFFVSSLVIRLTCLPVCLLFSCNAATIASASK